MMCLLLTCAVARVFALDCGRASTPVEQAICKQPDLAHLDADLNDVYDRLRPQLAPKARTEVLAQQRAWLAERNRVCANGDPECLRKEYRTRLDQLTALDAAAEAIDGLLSNLHPLVLKGSWKATAIYDPAAAGRAKETDLPRSLSREDLPAVGALVNATPGNVCVQGDECRMMAWTRTALAKVDGGEAIGRVLGLSQSDHVLLGNPGAKMSPPLVLISREDGKVWAVFGLCASNGMNCRNAAEEWTPVGPAPTVGLLP